MALTVGELQVVIDAELGPLRRDLKRLSDRFRQFERDTDRGFRGVQRGASGAGRGVRRLTLLVGGLATAVAAIAGGRLFASIVTGSVQASAAFEGFGVQLRALLGSQREANAALDTFIDQASRTPFAVQQIVGGATTLASVALGNRAALEELTFVATNLAAVTGLSFQDAAGNLQRALAGGIAAADLFRERGVRQLIESVRGIPDLTALPLAQQRQAFIDTFGDLGEFGTAAEDLSFTLGGALSNIGDAFQNLRAAIGDAIGPAVIDAARNVIIPFLNQLQQLVEENDVAVENFARGAIGFLLQSLAFLARSIIAVIRGFAQFQQGIREVAATAERFKAFLGLENDLKLVEQQLLVSRRELAEFENGLTKIENGFKGLERAAKRVADTPGGLGVPGAPVRPEREFETRARQGTKELQALKKAQDQENRRTQQLITLRDRLIRQDLERADALTGGRAGELFDIDRQIEEVSRIVGQATSATAQQVGIEALQALQAERDRILGEAAGLSEATKEALAEGLTSGFQSFIEGDFGGAGAALQDLFREQTQTALTEAFEGAVSAFEDLFSSALQAAGNALPSLFGEGGPLSGLLGPEAARGLLGIGGALFQGLTGGDADVRGSAAAVRSAVTSTQAVRGVVAGPTQIGIARVGESIAEAFEEPTRLLALIERNTRLALEDAGSGAAALADTGASLV